MSITVYFATDHAGYELKEILLAYVRDELGYSVVDCGATTFDSLDDFTTFIPRAAAAVSAEPSTRRAIILGGSGQGEAMSANRFPGVRAAVYYGGNESIVPLSREHNDANVLSIGARFVSVAEAKHLIGVWLQTAPLPDSKYQRRNQALEGLPRGNDIVPAIIPTSMEDVVAHVQQLPLGTLVQIDVVDGQFVPFTSWPYEPPGEVIALAPHLRHYRIEVDLMVADQLTAARAWLALGAQRIILHLEAITDPGIIRTLRAETMASIGIALTNDTPLADLTPYLDDIDFVQCMGIAQIGSQGQPFDERVLYRVATLQAEHPNLLISVDGGVNGESLPKLKAAGVKRFVIGSALWRADNVPEALTRFTLLS
jgi:ribose 5-phosphate isomerase B